MEAFMNRLLIAFLFCCAAASAQINPNTDVLADRDLPAKYKPVSAIESISSGGTGASTAADAREALGGAYSRDEGQWSGPIEGGIRYPAPGLQWIIATTTADGAIEWVTRTGPTHLVACAHKTNNGRLYYSGDSGTNWSIATTSTFTYFFRATAVGDDGVVLASSYDATQKFIYRSTDRGATWTRAEFPFPYPRWILSAGNGIVLAGAVTASTTWQLARSTDAGLNWSQVLLEAGAAVTGGRCAVIAEDRILVNSTTSMYESLDYGVSWTKYTGAPHTLDHMIYCGNGIIVGVRNGGRISRSTDYGRTWTEVLNTGDSQAYRCAYLGGKRVLAAISSATGSTPPSSLYLSEDTGLTWAKIAEINARYIYGLCNFGNGTVFIGTLNPMILKSTGW
jgi:photosystem II stability/assembly factor-like uncharacterized protein